MLAISDLCYSLAIGLFTSVATALVVVSFDTWSRFLCFLYIKLGEKNQGSTVKEKHISSHGGELVASVLKAHNVKYIFTLIGGHISPIVVAAKNANIKVVDTRHEVNAVFAADAVARLSGIVGVAVVTAGPGVTNTVTAIKNAQMAQSPILLIGGAAPTLLKERGALQDINQLSLFQSLCKYSSTVKTVREIIPVIRKAIQCAMSGTPGPVFVELPINVLYPPDIIKVEVEKSKGGKSFMSKIKNWYLDWHLYNLFDDGFIPQETSPLPVEVPLAKDFQVEDCANFLCNSSKPVIVLGSQALLPPSSSKKLEFSLNSLGIPCFLGGMSRGLLGRNNPLQLRHTRKAVLKEADLIILAGATCDFRLSYGKVLNKTAKVIAVNRNKKQMLMNSGMFWKPTLAVEGCVSDFIIRLSQVAKGFHCDTYWINKLRERDIAREKDNKEKAVVIPEEHLNALTVLHDLEDVINDDTILIADGGDFVGTASYILKPRGALKWLDPGPFGTLGVGAGFALGAKLCNPKSDVIILYGDGSLGFSLIEFDTFVRHKLSIIAVVGNDACWSQIARDQVPMLKSNAACSLEYSKYHTAVEGLGAKGILLEANDRENIKSILKNALASAQNGNSILVNVLISKNSFREGSISV